MPLMRQTQITNSRSDSLLNRLFPHTRARVRGAFFWGSGDPPDQLIERPRSTSEPALTVDVAPQGSSVSKDARSRRATPFLAHAAQINVVVTPRAFTSVSLEASRVTFGRSS